MSLTKFLSFTFFFFSCCVGSGCPTGWIKHETSFFFIDGNHISTWFVARSTCQNLGADLPVIRSRKDNDFIRSVALAVKPWKSVWLGLYRSDVDQRWYWVDDTPLAGGFTWWNPGEPSVSYDRCGNMFEVGKWNDAGCEKKQFRFICQLSSK